MWRAWPRRVRNSVSSASRASSTRRVLLRRRRACPVRHGDCREPSRSTAALPHAVDGAFHHLLPSGRGSARRASRGDCRRHLGRSSGSRSASTPPRADARRAGRSDRARQRLGDAAPLQHDRRSRPRGRRDPNSSATPTTGCGSSSRTSSRTSSISIDPRAGRAWSAACSGGRRSRFPNLFLPKWQIEGLATYEESVLTGEGRLHAGDFRAIVGRGGARAARSSRSIAPTAD